ncbi:hypothetical protein [Lentibacter sp. XHP0401]|uniref:hypothetical protein n=1 Tax=Lentibacter sp. XHP0401 TaxID=2984334 RepID=UPI0021E742E6|nr:hypothetical protein [Lentibacter sp. XHP0401]MCV2895005.1 hypothetical protein [Lentibacter sp. XHP0401]
MVADTFCRGMFLEDTAGREQFEWGKAGAERAAYQAPIFRMRAMERTLKRGQARLAAIEPGFRRVCFRSLGDIQLAVKSLRCGTSKKTFDNIDAIRLC